MSAFTPSRSLEQLRDWAREKSTEVAVPVPERALWTQIADEIDLFTGRRFSDDSTPATADLFGEIA